MKFPDAREIKVAAKWTAGYDYYYATGGEWVSGQWLHLMFTWKSGERISAYLNGCNMDSDGTKGYAYSSSRSEYVISS